MKVLKTGLAAVIMLTLTACSTPQIVTEYQTIKLAPPALLLNNCLGPRLPPSPASNLDILTYTIDLMLALDACNQDKARLREFYDHSRKIFNFPRERNPSQ